MSTAEHEPDGHGEGGDPFGADRPTRLWRRLAGVGLVSLVPATLTVLRMPDLLPWAALAVAVAVGGGVPASWWLSRRRDDPLRSHALAGAALGGLFGLWAAVWAPDRLVAVLTGAVATLSGAVVAAVATRVARWLPARVVRPAGAAVALSVVALSGAGLWVVLNPLPPTDLVALDPTTEVEEEFGDGAGLAEAIAETYERQLPLGPTVLSSATWSAVVSEVLDEPLGDADVAVRTTSNAELPSDPRTGEPWRLVDVVVRDRDPSSCVIVTTHDVTVREGRCEDLPDVP